MSEAFPIFPAVDLPVAAAFYARLGFRETYRFPDEGAPAFVTLELAGATFGLAADDGTAEVAYWVYVDDVDTTVAELRAAGTTVVAEPADQPWGERTASVRDPAGTLVHLGTRERV